MNPLRKDGLPRKAPRCFGLRAKPWPEPRLILCPTGQASQIIMAQNLDAIDAAFAAAAKRLARK